MKKTGRSLRLDNMKPILFNTEMVKAVISGKKTVTRRLLNPANKVKAKGEGYHQGYGLWIDPDFDNADGCAHIKDYSISPMWWKISSYTERYAPYHIGDILYVRETWNEIQLGNELDGFHTEYRYKADEKEINSENKWKPCIHMPRKAARIFLKVTDVRLEKLQNIFKDPPGSDNQIMKEGLLYGCDFIAVWNQTIKKNEQNLYGYDANPWVWVIEFAVINTTI